MSYWQNPKPSLRTRAVDIDAVAEAAVVVLDQGGIPALTMRAVAQRVGVAAPSLYSRVTAVGDLYDLALDRTLAVDAEMVEAIAEADLLELMIMFYRHLIRHPWACQVIGMRPPRGPAALRLSERMCVLLEQLGVGDSLRSAYALSSFVIGSATTAFIADGESLAPIDVEIAPVYARLHAGRSPNAEAVVRSGLQALLRVGGP